MAKTVVEKSAIRLRFGALEARLAAMHKIENDKRTNFQSRLKNLHRLGFPAGIGGKAGKAILYNEVQIAQMALAVEFIQAGLLPERLVKIYTENEYPILMAFSMAASALLRRPEGFDPAQVRPDNDPLSMFLYFDPCSLEPLMANKHDEDQSTETFFYGGSGVVAENIVRWTTGTVRRLTLINVTTMLWHLVADLEPAVQKVFLTSVSAWARDQITWSDFDLERFLRKLVEDRLSRTPNVPDPHGHIELVDLLDSLGYRDSSLLSVPTTQWGDASDLVMHFPGDRSMLIDAPDITKTSVSDRVAYLASLPFRAPFTDAANFVVLYVPERKLLEDALESDPNLFVRAYESRIILAAPRDLIRLLEAADGVWEADDEERREAEDTYGEQLADSGGKLLKYMTRAEFEAGVAEVAARAGLPRVAIREALDAARAERERLKSEEADAAQLGAASGKEDEADGVGN